MPAQRRIAPTDYQKISAEFFSRRADGLGDFFMFGASFVGRQGAGIRKDKKHGIFLRKSRRDTFRRPIGINRNAVDCLDAGRVVVEHDNFTWKIFQSHFKLRVKFFSVDARNFIEQFTF